MTKTDSPPDNMDFTTWAFCAGGLILLVLYASREPKLHVRARPPRDALLDP